MRESEGHTGRDQASKSNSISRLTTAQSQLTNWRSASCKLAGGCSRGMRKECLGVRFRATSGVPHERVGRIDRCRREREKERRKEREREREKARRGGWFGESARRVFPSKRGSRRENAWSVNERERVRMWTSADDTKYRVGAECAAAHLS